MQRILVVEDDWEMNQGICYVLKENGYTSVSAHSIAAAKAEVNGKPCPVTPTGEHKYISNVYGMGYQWIGQ